MRYVVLLKAAQARGFDTVSDLIDAWDRRHNTVPVAALLELVRKLYGWVSELSADPDARDAVEGQAIQACIDEVTALIEEASK